MISFIKYYTRYFVIQLIKLYQKTISFDHGIFKSSYPYGFCRYSPTCSEYAIDAVEKYGVFKGGVIAIWRVMRCNPWSKGGWDPLK